MLEETLLLDVQINVFKCHWFSFELWNNHVAGWSLIGQSNYRIVTQRGGKKKEVIFPFSSFPATNSDPEVKLCAPGGVLLLNFKWNSMTCWDVSAAECQHIRLQTLAKLWWSQSVLLSAMRWKLSTCKTSEHLLNGNIFSDRLYSICSSLAK